MKYKRKFLAVLLCAALCFSTVACGKDNGDGNGEKGMPQPTNPISQEENHFTEPGLHSINVTPSENVLIDADGTTEYKIVYPKNASKYVVTAANALRENIRSAVGAETEIAEESDESWNEDAKYIVIGDCDLFTAAGLTMPMQDIGATGVYVKTAGKSVFITGKGEYGVHNGVYVFLEHVFGHDHLYCDTTVFSVKAGDTVYLPTMDIVEKPDFEFNTNSTNMPEEAALANRWAQNAMWITPDEGSGDPIWHNSFNWFNEATRKANPNWVADDGQQLCYTGHGVEGELEKMLDHAAAYALKAIHADPTRNNITMTQQDYPTWCTCEACSAAEETYGTNAAVLVQFIKQLSARVNAELQEEAEEGVAPRTVRIWFFAYNATVKPPVKTESGQTVAFDESVTCDETVGVIMAPLEAKFAYTFYDEANEVVRENMKAWDACVKIKGAWLYSTDFRHFYYPYNSFDTIPENLRFVKSLGTMWIFNQGIGSGMTGFAAYKEHLNSKLYWNVNADAGAIRKSFFDSFYGEASEVMNKFYLETVAQCEWIYGTFDEMTGGVYEDLEQAKFWPKGLLERWVGYCDEGLQAIAKYENTDPVRYGLLKEHIVCESMFPRFALIRLYGSQFSVNALQTMKAEWKRDAQHYNFKSHDEGHSIDEIIKDW